MNKDAAKMKGRKRIGGTQHGKVEAGLTLFPCGGLLSSGVFGY